MKIGLTKAEIEFLLLAMKSIQNPAFTSVKTRFSGLVLEKFRVRLEKLYDRIRFDGYYTTRKGIRGLSAKIYKLKLSEMEALAFYTCFDGLFDVPKQPPFPLFNVSFLLNFLSTIKTFYLIP